MRTLALLTSFAVLGGCTAVKNSVQATKPIPQVAPAPMTMRSARTPLQVVDAADALLRREGWQISRPDSTPGVLTALRWRTPVQWGTAVKCGLRPESDAMKYAAAYYTVTVRAARAGSGSDVTVGGKVVTKYEHIAAGFGSHMKDSETDCVSTQEIEKRVSAVISER